MPRLAPFAERAGELEHMDDLSIRDDRIGRALDELQYVNQYLGGYRATRRSLAPLFAAWEGRPLRILDLGAGLADYAVDLIRFGERTDVRVEVTSVDANPEAVRQAAAYLDERLDADERLQARAVVADALNAPFPPRSFDVVTAALFLHHFDDARAIELLRAMGNMASRGILVNDLHRHPMAYAGIRSLAAILPVSPMFRHDGPLSVRRAFKPKELLHLAEAAGLTDAHVRRHWAFRLTLSTLPVASAWPS